MSTRCGALRGPVCARPALLAGLPALLLVAALAHILLPVPAMATGEVRQGAAAFGDWRTDAPGVQRLIRPADLGPPYASRSASNTPETVKRPPGAMPKVPPGFRVDLFKGDMQEPRRLAVAPNGDVFVAESNIGRIVVLRAPDGAPAATSGSVFADGLNLPYGIAFYPPGPSPAFVYVGLGDKVVRYPYRSGDTKASGPPQTIVPSLPEGGHWTRDVAFPPDGSRLFVAIGSASNVAASEGGDPPADLAGFEKRHGVGAMWGHEEGRANLLVFAPDGSNGHAYATGIRNCAGLAFQPGGGTPWCATNERDGLGDNLPPDYATAVKEGGFYGWPWYYIGDHPDPRFRQPRPELASLATVPDVLIQPHSAPLGIAFYDGRQFPPDYQGSAFVTLHGSWNRGRRTGYKVVRLVMQGGKPTGAYEDFVTGFVVDDGDVWGRPVGVAVAHDGALLVSEDGNGSIWRISHVN